MQGLLPLLIRETDLEIAQAVLALNNDNKISDFQFHSPYAAYICLLPKGKKRLRKHFQPVL